MSGNAHFLRGSNLAGYALGLISVFSPLAVAQPQAPLDLSSISQEALRADLRREILTRERMGLPPVGEDYSRSGDVVRGTGASPLPACRKYDRRSLISYISDDGALRSGLRLRRDQVMLEFSYTLDGAAPKPTAEDHCRPASNWQGWGAIIYREVSGDKDKGNPTKGDIIREVNEERYRTNRGINATPAQIPEPR